MSPVMRGFDELPGNIPQPPPFPSNRELWEGEMPCRTCGRGEQQHRHMLGERPLGHAYTFTRFQRFIAKVTLWLWPTKHAMYVAGKIGRP